MVRPSIHGLSSLVLAVTLAGLGGCDVVVRPDIPAQRVPPDASRPAARVEPAPGPCDGDDADVWYGCPGNPCAHGWCFVGKCIGEEVARDGVLLDPGVCCVDGECLEIDP